MALAVASAPTAAAPTSQLVPAAGGPPLLWAGPSSSPACRATGSVLRTGTNLAARKLAESAPAGAVDVSSTQFLARLIDNYPFVGIFTNTLFS
jgi:hypothetical protein